ncbi:pseudouridine synthase [Serratia ureilytica]
MHRLDMATSGVIVVALNKAAERELKRQFREREPKKSYIARVWGHMAHDEGLVDLPLICDWPNRPLQRCVLTPAKRRRRSIRCCRDADGSTRVKLTPITGRSHQLRVHMLALGHPISATVSTPPPEAGDGAAAAAACARAAHHPPRLPDADALSRRTGFLRLISGYLNNSSCRKAATKRCPGSVQKYVTGVSAGSQHTCSSKYDGYRYLKPFSRLIRSYAA